MIIVFLFSFFIIVYVYFLYPILLCILSWFSKPMPHEENSYEPFVTVVIPAHNEKSCIVETICNKLEQDYPKDKLDIIVISDGSTDGTDQAVEDIADPRIRLFRQEPRRGKTAGLNTVIPHVKGEIVVLSDANTIYAPDVVKKLVRRFAHAEIGYVTGRMIYISEDKNVVGEGCQTYMDYESWVHSYESRLGSVIGCDGGIDAVRKKCWVSIPDDLISDFVVPLKILENGKKVLFEKDAISYEMSLGDPHDEINMRTRVTVRALRGIWHMRALLNPVKYPRVSFQLISHKILRYYAPVFLLLLFLSNIYLAISNNLIFLWLLIMQISGYLLGYFVVFVKIKKKSLIHQLAGYFVLVNFAALKGIVLFHTGKKFIIWNPRTS